MTRRRAINLSLTVIVIAVVASLLWQSGVPDEPVYKGKPLTYWLDHAYGDGNWSEQSEYDAREAMRAAGTNAIPTLLLDLQARDHPRADKVSLLLWRLGLRQFTRISEMDRYSEAVVGFEVLGARAETAIPALVEIYKKGISQGSRSTAIKCLGEVDADSETALPVLIEALSDTNYLTSLSAAGALRRIRQKQLAIPALIKLLQGSNDFGCVQAEQCLIYFGPEAKAAIPALTKLVYDGQKSHQIRSTALEAVETIDPDSARAIPDEVRKKVESINL